MTEADWSRLNRSNRLLWGVVILQSLLILGMLGWQLQTRQKLSAKEIRADELIVRQIRLEREDGKVVGNLDAGKPGKPYGVGPSLCLASERTPLGKGVFRVDFGNPEGPELHFTQGDGLSGPSVAGMFMSIHQGQPAIDIFSSENPSYGDDTVRLRWEHQGYGQDKERYGCWYFEVPGFPKKWYPGNKTHLADGLQALTPEDDEHYQQDIFRQLLHLRALRDALPLALSRAEAYPDMGDFPKGLVWAATQRSHDGTALLASLARKPSCTAVQLLGETIEKGMDTVGETDLRKLLAKLAEDSELSEAVRKCAQSQLESVRQHDRRMAERPQEQEQ